MNPVVDRVALEAFQRALQVEQDLNARIADVAALMPPDEGGAVHEALLALTAGAEALKLQVAQVLADERPLRIAVVGDYSAGKSSFINHLLEDDTLCPVRDDPTTSHVTVFGYSPVERIARTTDGGRAVKLTRDQYVAQVQSSGKGRTSGKARRFIIGAPISVLRGVELLDTPGFNNLQNAGDTAVTESVLSDVDAVLFLVDINSGTIPESGAQRLRTIRTQVGMKAPIRVMFTKADTKAPPRLRALKEDCQQKHGQLFDGDVLAYSTHDLGERHDLVSRVAMSGLFEQMSAARQHKELDALAQAMRLHLAQRAECLSRWASEFDALIAAYTAHGAKMANGQARIRDRVDRMQSDMGVVYKAEVCDSLRRSFSVVEIGGTGWFFKDARIVSTGPGFANTLAAFESVGMMREQMRAEVRRLIPEHEELAFECIELNFSAAQSDTVDKANKLMKAAFSDVFGRTYDYDTTAREKLREALNAHASAFAEALWQDWILWIEGIYENLEEYCIAPAIEHARVQTMMLKNLQDECCALLPDLSAPTHLRAA